MIDLAHLRAHPDLYKHAVRVKRIDVDIDGFLTFDTLYRDLLKLVEEMRAQKNSVSKRIPGMKGKEKESALADMKALAESLKEREAELTQTEDAWEEMQLLLPTLPLKKVPVGETSEDNKEAHSWGDPPKFSFEPKDHVTLGETLGILDIPRGVKVAGPRSYFLKGDGARLELAVLQFALDSLLKKGWTLFSPPLMANWDCLMGTGFFPGAEEQTYAVHADNLYLIGTSEVSVASYHKDETLSASELPKKYAGFSACFRREAGTYGKDTKGLYRVHQFQKVEQVVLCEADEKKALTLFEEIRTNAEEVLQALKLPYRVMTVCTGDMGKGKVFMQDIETWMPSRKAYSETHSCSYLGDFQARRLGIRYSSSAKATGDRQVSGSEEKKFVHTLNNTCIASPRILIPLLEVYQNADGSVTIPEVLRPYMQGQERITR